MEGEFLLLAEVGGHCLMALVDLMAVDSTSAVDWVEVKKIRKAPIGILQVGLSVSLGHNFPPGTVVETPSYYLALVAVALGTLLDSGNHLSWAVKIVQVERRSH